MSKSRKFKIEKIHNGWLRHSEDICVYHEKIETLLESLTESIEDDYFDARQHEWDGKFEVTVEHSFSNMK